METMAVAAEEEMLQSSTALTELPESLDGLGGEGFNILPGEDGEGTEFASRLQQMAGIDLGL